MKKYIIIQADTNDADYISNKSEITDEELEIIMPVIKAIRAYEDDETIKKQKWNWDVEGNKDLTPDERYLKSGLVTEEAFDYFNEFCPHSGDTPVHSIDSIELLEVINETKLF